MEVCSCVCVYTVYDYMVGRRHAVEIGRGMTAYDQYLWSDGVLGVSSNTNHKRTHGKKEQVYIW